MLSILHFDFNNTHIFISLFLVQYVVFLNITSIKKKELQIQGGENYKLLISNFICNTHI